MVKVLSFFLFFPTLGYSVTIVGEWTATSNGSTVGTPAGTTIIGGFEYDSEAVGLFYVDDAPVSGDAIPSVDFQLNATDFIEYPAAGAWYEVDGSRVEATEGVKVRVRNQLDDHAGFAPQDFFTLFVHDPPISFHLSDIGERLEATLINSHDLPISQSDFDSAHFAQKPFGNVGAGPTNGDLLEFDLRAIPEPEAMSILVCGCLVCWFVCPYLGIGESLR